MANNWGLFERFGVELEYMIVDTGSLQVRPIADKIVHAIGLTPKNEVKHGNLRWSNELVLHVIELKTDGPARRLDGLAERFQREVRFLNEMLAEYACMLLPTAMHPWMDPNVETKLWPHGNRTIYEAFDRIFGCRGHGWSNLQSTHLNLSFATPEEFARLHRAIRLVLPLLPALAASSPFEEGKVGEHLDRRLENYRNNCARIPSITGSVVPEAVSSPAEYGHVVLDRIVSDLAPYDPERILHPEWVNARGAIPRFSRGAIEIRVLDIQENPAMDLAILEATVAILRAFVAEQFVSTEEQHAVPTDALAKLFLATVREGRKTPVSHPAILQAYGKSGKRTRTVEELLAGLVEKVASDQTPWRTPVDKLIEQGNLAERLRKAAGPAPSRARLREIYAELASCLATGEPFRLT